MMAQMFLCIIPRLPATGIALCKKETPSTSKLCRDRKARRRPTCQRLWCEGVGNHSAGRKRPPAGFFILEPGMPRRQSAVEFNRKPCAIENREQKATGTHQVRKTGGKTEL